MNAKNSVRLLVAAVAALLVALFLSRREHAALAVAHAAVEVQNRELRGQLAASQKKRQRAEVDARAREEAPLTSFAPRGGIGVSVEPVREVFLGAPPPEMQRLHALHERAALDARYAALFKALKLPPEKLERFKNLLVEREVAFAEVMAAAIERGIDLHGDPEAMRRAVTAAQGAVDRSIREELGDAAYSDYDQYRQTLAQRAIVNQLEQRLSYTGEPLSAAQSSQLLQTLAAAPSAAPSSAVGFAGDAVFIGASGPAPLVSGPPISDAAVAQAQGFLTPQQLRALLELQAQQRAQQELLQNLAPPFAGPGGGSISIRTEGPPGRK